MRPDFVERERIKREKEHQRRINGDKAFGVMKGIFSIAAICCGIAII